MYARLRNAPSWSEMVLAWCRMSKTGASTSDCTSDEHGRLCMSKSPEQHSSPHSFQCLRKSCQLVHLPDGTAVRKGAGHIGSDPESCYRSSCPGLELLRNASFWKMGFNMTFALLCRVQIIVTQFSPGWFRCQARKVRIASLIKACSNYAGDQNLQLTWHKLLCELRNGL